MGNRSRPAVSPGSSDTCDNAAAWVTPARASAPGAASATLARPTLFVMEGGYAVDDIGLNAVGVLQGFERR